MTETSCGCLLPNPQPRPVAGDRHYEMAGAGHATPDELYFGPAPDDIVKAGRTPPPLSCNEGPRSRFPSNIFSDAVMRNLDSWVSEGIVPPHADPILVQNGAAVLDQFGNVVGGLRSPFVDVPTSTWFGSSTGASFCFTPATRCRSTRRGCASCIRPMARMSSP